MQSPGIIAHHRFVSKNHSKHQHPSQHDTHRSSKARRSSKTISSAYSATGPGSLRLHLGAELANDIPWRVVLADDIPIAQLSRRLFQKPPSPLRIIRWKDSPPRNLVPPIAKRPPAPGTRRVLPHQLRKVARRLAEPRGPKVILRTLVAPRIYRFRDVGIAFS